MGVDHDRQATASRRRGAIIEALNSGFSSDADSHLSAFRRLVEGPESRYLIANADIDGIISAQMLAAVTDWRIGALIDRTGAVRVHPDFASVQAVLDTGRAFGVDTFSPLFPSISNHPVYFRPAARTPKSIRQALADFDTTMERAVEEHHALNLSAWVGIGAWQGSTSPIGMPYKYPLGSAQLLLAVLESAGASPRIYDRQYLPWLIANCDGGVDTIRAYAWNAEMWWSSLAAVVGPASNSEALYRLVTSQRPNEFLDMDRRLRYEEPERSRFLNSRWNLRAASPEALESITGLISDLSGWPDPFRGGVRSLQGWQTVTPTRNVLRLAGLTKVPASERDAHLEAARSAMNVNFSTFRERGKALGWSLAGTDSIVEAAIGVSDLIEEIPDDEPTVPDADEA